MFFSVIMPVTLQEYEGSAKNREEKFKRAVKSFLNTIFDSNQSELIIVSDGCDKAEKIFNTQFSKYKNLTFFKIKKQQLFSGFVRQFGIENSKSDYILYLDSDDVLGEWHLYNIYKGIVQNNYPDWVYFNDYIVWSLNNIAVKNVSLQYGSIGTSSICHKRLDEFNWEGCNGYGHDWVFIQKLLNKNNKPPKIKDAQYFIHHIPNVIDF